MAEGNTIFFNAGYNSRQPYLDNIFNRNTGFITELVSPAVENEKITSFEAGYHFKTNNFRANFNAYVTNWTDRTLSSFGAVDTLIPSRLTVLVSPICSFVSAL